MASFFSKYPKMLINNKIVTDIISRSAIRQKYSDKLSIYYPYNLQEGDTPELIAAKYYGDPERHWVVMLANDIINPFFDFPLDYQTFEKYLDDKYKIEGQAINRSGSEFCKITTNISPPGYRVKITSTDVSSGESTIQTIYIDEKAYNAGVNGYDDDAFNFVNSSTESEGIVVTVEKEMFTVYDYESELNEKKREIKLIRKEYVGQLEKELKYIMGLKYV